MQTPNREALLAVGFWQDHAESLNLLAWRLLTEQAYGHRFDALALSASRRSNELTGNADWRYLETLALALFQNGDVQRARCSAVAWSGSATIRGGRR